MDNNWSDFFINEGFTMFLQRKIEKKAYEEDLSKLGTKLMYNELSNDIVKLGDL